MLTAVINAFKIRDLRQKILFTLGMLAIFRFVASIPVPGVDREGLREFVQNNELLGMLNLFSGSGLQYFWIAEHCVCPYITESITMRLMTPIIPRLS